MTPTNGEKHMILLIGILACGEKETDSGTEEFLPINGTLRLLSAESGSPIPGIAVSAEDSTDVTGDDGRATVTVAANSTYTLRASESDSMDHLYQGVSGEDDFEVIGFFVNRRSTETVFSFMNVSQSPDKGIVVAALDEPDLSPAGGASALLNNSSDGAFIFGSNGMPASGNVIDEVGSSVVYFPNVDPGVHELEAFGAEGTVCSSYPAGQSTYTVNVEADAVSVVVFSCE